MTIQEIKDLVDKRIAGQGNQVDCGSALPSVLNELVDLVGSQAETIESMGETIAAQSEQITALVAKTTKKIIDLSGYELSVEDVEVNEAIPEGLSIENANEYLVKYAGNLCGFNGGMGTYFYYGYQSPSGVFDEAEVVRIAFNSGRWVAAYQLL